ncbi:NusA antitermination factor [Desulfacinum hydrothermale DSM 13146]|uniref:Transcription termination/antitermination protein NusA n=1 Tax=Desulfacinum hydrothermale DSM 13146 TaxID=1121390 RepID=A0A1W1X8U9_9BACT|nr:transcription termination factor NusA [Desulfacinum hydrothermale]SMC20392.1 NusA antitermination factor [Desulfacinum hydrothermale DSM 13146]
MDREPLKRLVDQVSREKGIDRTVLIEALEEAVKSAVKKRYGSKIDVEVSFNEEFGEMEAFLFKEVVETVTDPDKEISLAEAQALDPESELGDELGIRMDTDTLGRIAAQSAKQVIIQKMKDAEREATYEEYKDRRREIITGIVQRVDRSGIIVNLGRAEAILPVKEQIPREIYRQGDRIRAYILDVKKITKGPQIILSRTHPDFLIQLFRMEVPEVADGTVSILAAAREPGSRAKIAVVSRDPNVDPVGACVGMKGSRVQAVVQELRGERIDIVPWNMDPAKFVVNALAPAIITKVIIDQTNKSMEVVVPDDQLSLAIGRRGQNVRLASRITGWHIDVKSEARYERQKQAGYQSLLHVDDLSEEMADRLYEAGITSLEEFCEADLEELQSIIDLSEAALAAMQTQARELLEYGFHDQDEWDDEMEAPVEEEETVEESAEPAEAPPMEEEAMDDPGDEIPEESQTSQDGSRD